MEREKLTDNLDVGMVGLDDPLQEVHATAAAVFFEGMERSIRALTEGTLAALDEATAHGIMHSALALAMGRFFGMKAVIGPEDLKHQEQLLLWKFYTGVAQGAGRQGKAGTTPDHAMARELAEYAAAAAKAYEPEVVQRMSEAADKLVPQ